MPCYSIELHQMAMVPITLVVQSPHRLGLIGNLVELVLVQETLVVPINSLFRRLRARLRFWLMPDLATMQAKDIKILVMFSCYYPFELLLDVSRIGIPKNLFNSFAMASGSLDVLDTIS